MIIHHQLKKLHCNQGASVWNGQVDASLSFSWASRGCPVAEETACMIPTFLSHVLPILLLAGARVIHLVSDTVQRVFLFMFSTVCFTSLKRGRYMPREESKVSSA